PLAILCFRRVVRVMPDWVDAHYNLGIALHDAQIFEDAAEAFRRAAQIQPGDSRIWNNLGNSLFAIGEVDAAIGCYTRALALREGSPDRSSAASARSAAAIRYNRGLARLMQGDYAHGFADMATRYDDANIVAMGGYRAHASPRWRGEDIAGRTIMIVGEQGMGDTVQFVRYLPMLKARGAKILFRAHAALLPLLRDLGAIDRLLPIEGQAEFDERIDFHAPLLDLPHLFATTLETVPAEIPYLRVDPARVAAWRAAIPADGYKIGIVWAGNPANPNDRLRSCALANFAPLAGLPGVALYALQKGDASLQIKGATFPIVDLAARSNDFADTAAAIESLDLVISVDTAIVHVVGALGRPAWVLLHQVPDWRWMLGRDDSPWYPSLRLFRQTERGNWSGVFEQVEAALRHDAGD
ncbi:MAG: tetratricopeptide repeat protein, partial [Alphaproteobacteria bacterium]